MNITSGLKLIAVERQRQIDDKEWSADHDDGHDRGELADAARCYLRAAQWADAMRNRDDVDGRCPAWARDSMAPWPWDESWWKPSPDAERNLEKAGVLIVAELDRLLRRRMSQVSETV